MERLLTRRLLQWKTEKDRKPLILKGVRQVGKTHLLKELGRCHFTSCHYFNFEKEPNLRKIFEPDLIPKNILTRLSFHQDRPIHPGEDLVIFDEIQECPSALTSLKYFQEECEDLHLCSAGSLLGLHLSGGSFPVGKVTFEILRPMSFEEFLMANEDKALSFLKNPSLPETVHLHLWEQLLRYWFVGGLPEAISIFCTRECSPA